jgi:hypothetical protein
VDRVLKCVGILAVSWMGESRLSFVMEAGWAGEVDGVSGGLKLILEREGSETWRSFSGMDGICGEGMEQDVGWRSTDRSVAVWGGLFGGAGLADVGHKWS